MPVPTFCPTKENDLLTWSSNYTTLIGTSPTTYGLTTDQATAYGALHSAFASAYAVVKNPNTNSKAAVIAKNTAKENLLYGPNGAWQLVNIVQAYPETTNTMRGELGLRIPDNEMTPVPPPAFAPDLSILATMGRTVKVRLRDQENPNKRGKPTGVQGATVVYYVGEEAPADPSQWVFALITSKTVFEFDVPFTVAAGSKVWLTAFWFNARKQTGPAALPESTRVSDGMSMAA